MCSALLALCMSVVYITIAGLLLNEKWEQHAQHKDARKHDGADEHDFF